MELEWVEGERQAQEIVRAKVQEKLKMKVRCGGGKDGKEGGMEREGKSCRYPCSQWVLNYIMRPQLGSN